MDGSDPLLSYEITTDPLPLQVNAPSASVTIAASNPGDYSDNADTNYVAPTQFVFLFADSLTANPAAIAASATYTPKGGTATAWPVPQRTGAQFTFTPPSGAQIFPADGLSFQFAGIAVGGQVASVALNLTETASSPGDPAFPGGYYPAQPSQQRYSTRQIGVFPVNFTIETLSSSPTTVAPGRPAQLSWKASQMAGTVFTLVYAANGAVQSVKQHADGTPLRAIDTYPNSSDDPGIVLSISRTTSFSLQATYTQDGNSVTAEKQITVSVPDPTINTFTATPSTGLMVGSAVSLAWQTLAADYVTIDPPLDGVNSTVAKSGSTTIYPLSYQRYTLTASGRGLNVREDLTLFPMAPGWTTVNASAPWLAGLAPLTLAVNGLLLVLPGSFNAAPNPLFSSPDGETWIMVDPDAGFPLRQNAAGLSDPANQAAWVMGGLGSDQAALNDVWFTSDGRTFTQKTASAQWSPRSDFGCVWFNNQIWVMGGKDGSGNLLNDIWTSPDGATWTQQPAPDWSARSAFGLTVFNGKMVLLGGQTSGGASSEFWSGDGATWTISGGLGTAPSARTHCQLFARDTASLYAIGGLDFNGNTLHDAWMWSSSSRRWQVVVAPPVPQTAKYFGATAYNGGFWLTGGGSDSSYGSGVWLFVPTI